MESPIPVTLTRILLPRRRSDLLSRERLLALLYDLLDNKLTIVAAPAGYGKTSLLIDFAAHIEYPVCWYAIDPLDRDPQRFLAYFISALHVRFPRFGERSMAALSSAIRGDFNLDHLTTIIVNDAYEHISEHFVIVLDDYHLVDGSKPVDQFVSRFIQDVDENGHMMIASRTLLTLPDFPLMVARSQVGGLSFEELAFQSEELQTLLLQNYQLSLSNEASQELVINTEGWITGILLSTQTIQQRVPDRRRAARVSGVGLNEYLEQVLVQLSPQLQTFLLRSSLLEEFDARLCAEVIGAALELENEDWDGWIEALVRSNVFVLMIGEDRIWLRYHHLFRDFLRARMRRELPEETRRIQHGLAAYYTRMGDWETAYHYYRQLGDHQGLCHLIEQAGSILMAGGRVQVLSKWLDDLPRELFNVQPALISLQGSIYILQGNTAQGLQLLSQAIAGLENTGNQPLLARTLMRRSIAYRMTGDYRQAIADGDRALEMAKSNPAMRSIEAEVLRVQGSSYYNQGNLKEALAWLSRSMEIYRTLGDSQNETVVLMETGLINQALGDYTSAERNYNQALDHWRTTGNSLWQANVLNNLGFLQHMRGDYETAASTLEKGLEHAKIVRVPYHVAFALTNIGDLYRDLQALDESHEAYAQAAELAQRIGERFLMVYLALAEATLERLKGNFIQAGQRLETARSQVAGRDSQHENYLCDLEEGMLRVAAGSPQGALEPLRKAYEYFLNAGLLVEAARSCLYLAIANQQQGQTETASNYLAQSLTLVIEPEKQQPLIVNGYWERERLAAFKDEQQTAGLVAPYLRQIKQFEQRLPSLRRRLRQRASVVPFAPPKMIIRAFGKSQVRLNERLITGADWQTQAARDLFFILLSHPEGMTREMIGNIFWPDISPEELKLRFKNTIYRVRHAAGKQSIILQDEYYRFNRALDYEYDAEDFQKAIRQAQRVASAEEKINQYRIAIRLYKGQFLPDIEEAWNLAERERLFQMYLEALRRVAELSFEGGQHQVALDYIHRALVADPCLEAAHRLAMRVHASMGNRAAVARQYDRCRQALLAEINAQPSQQTQQLLDTLMH
ncbi:MAG TPA: tetratricopeptide repeat protein [Levilinea sp.]|nr:tetratricopeptide repeat protein [Levilinea sp.]